MSNAFTEKISSEQQASNIRHNDFRPPFILLLSSVRHAAACKYPPHWILKWGGLESSGGILISLNGKTINFKELIRLTYEVGVQLFLPQSFPALVSTRKCLTAVKMKSKGHRQITKELLMNLTSGKNMNLVNV